MSQPDPAAFLPLREPTFYILLSLLPGQRHGYAILKDVEALSAGRLRLSTGTLYEALGRLLEQELVERVDEDAGNGPGKPRKFYRLTLLGRLVVEAETKRLDNLAAAGRRQLGERWTRNSPTA